MKLNKRKNIVSTLGSLLLLGFAFVMFSGFSCGTPEPPPPIGCKSDRDCASSDYCALPKTATHTEPATGKDLKAKCAVAPEPSHRRGQCRPRRLKSDCRTSSDCRSGFICKTTYERHHSCGSSKTRSDSEDVMFAPEPCPAVAVIVKKCVPAPTPKCYSDSDCKSNERCKITEQKVHYGCAKAHSTDYRSKRAPCMPPRPSGVCVKKETNKKCYSSRDCGQDEYCKILQACGAEKPKPGMDNSMPPSCKAAYAGVCTKKPQPKRCKSSRDCGSGESCIKEPTALPKCGTRTTPDSTDGARRDEAPSKCGNAEMPPAPTYGICKRMPPRPNKCKSDRDCASTEHCVKSQVTTTKCEASTKGSNCKRMPAPPSPYGFCQKKPAKTHCYTDSDCKSGQRCLYSGDPQEETDRLRKEPQGTCSDKPVTCKTVKKDKDVTCTYCTNGRVSCSAGKPNQDPDGP